MVKVVGVKFKQNGKVYYFDPLDYDVKNGTPVIVETSRGIEYGTVSGEIRDVNESEITSQLKPIIRLATPEDTNKLTENRVKEEKAYIVCLEKIAKHGLDMKLVNVEYTFDGSKILFYFTSDGRVDFRELVKDLAGIYHTRIELRQIGVRDETKTMGGIGICGREFCCHAFQSDFQPVSIKMAKNQNLSLNPSKIYGSCGRLMCCIRYEEETYRELNKNLPKVGDEGTTEDGLKCRVNAVNILRQRIKVIVDLGNDEKEIREYNPGDIKFYHKNKGNKEKQAAPTLEELQILEDLKKDKENK